MVNPTLVISCLNKKSGQLLPMLELVDPSMGGLLLDSLGNNLLHEDTLNCRKHKSYEFHKPKTANDTSTPAVLASRLAKVAWRQ